MFRNLAVAAVLVLALGGCAADSVQVTLGAKDIAEALSGGEVTVPFVATFSSFGDLDAEKRSELEALEAVARKHLQIDEFEIEQADSKLTVTVEGELPLVYATTPSSSPWIIQIDDVSGDGLETLFSHSIQFTIGAGFKVFAREAKGISYMAAPDEVQPVRFRVRANAGAGLRLLAGGYQEGAASHMLNVVEVPEGESASLLFSGGAYKSVGGGFWVMRE